MTALLTLLLGATAVLVPPGASSDPRRGAGTRSALAQSAAQVLGVLLGSLSSTCRGGRSPWSR